MVNVKPKISTVYRFLKRQCLDAMHLACESETHCGSGQKTLGNIDHSDLSEVQDGVQPVQGQCYDVELMAQIHGKHVMWVDSCSSLVVSICPVCRPALWPITALSPQPLFLGSSFWKRTGSWSAQNCNM